MFYSAAMRLLKTNGSQVRAAKRVTWIAEEGTRLLSINVARLPEQMAKSLPTTRAQTSVAPQDINLNEAISDQM